MLQLLTSNPAGRTACQAALDASEARATACTVAAIRTALCIASRLVPCCRSWRSWATTHVPQPLITETASDRSSKSILSIPGLPMTFMRNRAGSCLYSSSSTRCRKRRRGSAGQCHRPNLPLAEPRRPRRGQHRSKIEFQIARVVGQCIANVLESHIRPPSAYRRPASSYRDTAHPSAAHRARAEPHPGCGRR
jgi:hypothetical protein